MTLSLYNELARRIGRAARLGALLGILAPVAVAQRVDSARVTPRARTTDTTKAVAKPPLSPRRAFLYSALLPGYGQSVLGRPGAGALFVLTESIAIAMLRESRADLAEARALQRDSLVAVGVDASGQTIMARNSYDQQLIDVRRGHVEDWVAFLFANHLFAAADAYVAAHLWDLPAQVSIHGGSTGPVLAARVQW